jgi:hypothetical protein
MNNIVQCIFFTSDMCVSRVLFMPTLEKNKKIEEIYYLS